MNAERYLEARKRFEDATKTAQEAIGEMDLARKEMELVAGVERAIDGERALPGVWARPRRPEGGI